MYYRGGKILFNSRTQKLCRLKNFQLWGGVETGETKDVPGTNANERESRPNELNDPAVSGFVDKVEKYMRGESTGYFHHGSLIMDTKRAFEKAGISLEFLNKWIPDWKSKLAEATSERSEKQLESHGGIPKVLQSSGRETLETKMSPEKQENLDNAILLVEDRVRRRSVPDDFLYHLEKGDRSYVDQFFPSLGVNDLNKWTNRELFLLWQGVVALKEKKDATYRERVAEETKRMQEENELMKEKQEREYRKKRKISDEEIAREASSVASGLSRGDDPMRFDYYEFEKSIRPYFERGSHPDYLGYSGEDLRFLCLSVRNIMEKEKKSGF